MKKALFIGIGLLILMFWGSAVFGILLHIVVIVLETLELLVDTFLENVMGLGLYEAQAVTAWLGFGTLLLLVVVGLKKLTAYLQRLRIQAPEWWKEEKVRLRAMRSSLGWPMTLVILVAFLIVAMFL